MNRGYILVIAFISVVLIWSTTPLAIKWSGEDVGFLFGVTLRMFIGAVLSLVLVLLYYRRLPLHRTACHVYFAAGTAIFGAMLAVYWGAQYISSGLVSVVFGMTPIVTAFIAAKVLQEHSLSLFKLAGSMIGIAGLVVIFSEQLDLGEHAAWGITAVLVSVLLHSISAVWIKRINSGLPALVITAGGLAFALPLFIMVYAVFAGPLPDSLPLRPVWSIVYLGIMGSVVGFVCYYFVLANMNVSTVALITLITPVLALWLGYFFNGENINVAVIGGTALVLSGLVIHQWGGRLKR